MCISASTPIQFLLILLNVYSDLQGIKCFARKDGSDYILNGSKCYISNGWLCDTVIVVAVTDKQAKSPAHGISLFLVDNGTPGFQKSWLMKKIGLKAFVSDLVTSIVDIDEICQSQRHNNKHTILV